MKIYFLLISISYSISNSIFIGDIKPFCNFPEKFPTSLQPFDGKVNLNRYAGLWYDVASK